MIYLLIDSRYWDETYFGHRPVWQFDRLTVNVNDTIGFILDDQPTREKNWQILIDVLAREDLDLSRFTTSIDVRRDGWPTLFNADTARVCSVSWRQRWRAGTVSVTQSIERRSASGLPVSFVRNIISFDMQRHRQTDGRTVRPQAPNDIDLVATTTLLVYKEIQHQSPCNTIGLCVYTHVFKVKWTFFIYYIYWKW